MYENVHVCTVCMGRFTDVTFKKYTVANWPPLRVRPDLTDLVGVSMFWGGRSFYFSSRSSSNKYTQGRDLQRAAAQRLQ